MKTSIKKRMKEHTMVYPNNRVGHSEKKGQTTDKPVQMNLTWSVRSPKQKYALQVHIYEVQEQAKIIYNDKDQKVIASSRRGN